MLSFLSNLIKPLFGTIDKLDISGNDKLKLRNELAKIEADLSTKFLELEKARLEAHAKAVEAEAASPHKITAIWRPVASLALISIAIFAAFDIVSPNQNFWDLVSLVIGGHVIGRSAEKGISTIASAIGKK